MVENLCSSVGNATEQEESDGVSGGPLSCGQCVGNRERGYELQKWKT